MKRLTLLALGLAVAAGCTVTSSPGPAYPANEPPPPPSDATSEAPPPPPPPSDSGAQASGRIRVRWHLDTGWRPEKQWEELGALNVSGQKDEDSVQGHIPRKRWSALAFTVVNSDLDVYDVVLHLPGGRAYVPELKHHFTEGQRTIVIELPKGADLIEMATFRYGAEKGGGKARVKIYGLPQ